MEEKISLVSREEEIEFRKKYKLSVIEAEAVLYQRENTLTSFEKGRRYKLYNEEFVRKMIDNENEFKEHIQKLYDEGKIIKRIYAKVFTEDVLKSKEKMDEEKYKYFNKDIAEKVLEFQNLFEITDKCLMNIFDLNKNEVELLKQGIFVDDRKAKAITDVLGSKDSIINEIRKKVKEEKINSKIAYNLIDKVAVHYREEKEGNNARKINNKKEKELEETTETNLEERDMLKYSELDKKRKEAKKELEAEYNGITEKTNKRDKFIEALYKQYTDNEKIDSEDIKFIKENMMLHTNMVSIYTLKIVILGSLRTEGYEAAHKHINELIANTENQNYRVKLVKFRRKLNDEYNKMKIDELRKEGYDKYQIIKELNLTTNDFWRLVDEGR